MSAKSRRREATKKPRAAYCTGCDVIFPKMHLLINHRRQKRCGGRFLPEPERDFLNRVRLVREECDRDERIKLQIAKEQVRTGRYT